MLGSCWTHLGSCWTHVGLIWAHAGLMLGSCWAHLGSSCRLVHLTPPAARPPMLDAPCWAHVGLMLGSCVTHLGSCWAHVGLIWAHVGLIWAHVGLMGSCWAHVWTGGGRWQVSTELLYQDCQGRGWQVPRSILPHSNPRNTARLLKIPDSLFYSIPQTPLKAVYRQPE